MRPDYNPLMRIKNGVIILKKKVFLVILCMFILFLIIWGVNYYTYHKYIDSSFEHLPGTLGTFLTDSDNKYSYLVGKPALFEFSGCLSRMKTAPLALLLGPDSCATE